MVPSARREFSAHDGVLAAARLAYERPARLGATRLVAVDGPSGSGKTTVAPLLASALAQECGGAVITPRRTDRHAHDCPELRVSGTASWDAAARGRAVPTGARRGVRTGAMTLPTVAVVSTDLLATWEHPLDWWPVLDGNLLAPIEAGREATMPVIEWASGNPRPGGAIILPPVDVLVLEGVSSGRQAVAERISMLVWVEVPGAVERLERAVARDGEAMRPHLARWQQQEAEHFAADGTRARTDVVISPPL